MVFGQNASESDFHININHTQDAGDANIQEAYITYLPTNEIVFALVDGEALTSINLQIAGTDQSFDLLA